MTQNQEVLERLREGPLTPLQAVRMGILRLGARIYDLRQEGVKIKSERITKKTSRGHKTYAKYSLS
jgi:hypothetical protein